jgi:hypothetical protein
MSANIKKWTERLTDGQHNFASTNEARDAEIADLRAALQAQQGEAKAPVYQVRSGDTGEWYDVAKEQWERANPAYRRPAAPAPATLSDEQIGEAVQRGYSRIDDIRMDYCDLANVIAEIRALLASAGNSQGQDTGRIDYLESKIKAAAARGFKWDSISFDTDKSVRLQIDAAMAAREGKHG